MVCFVRARIFHIPGWFRSPYYFCKERKLHNDRQVKMLGDAVQNSTECHEIVQRCPGTIYVFLPGDAAPFHCALPVGSL
jgi:hypothetical protein